MSWGIMTDLFAKQGGSISLTGAAGNESFTTDSVRCQRLIDEQGAFTVGFNPNPGNIQGTVALQGKLSAEASWGDVFISAGPQVTLDLDDVASPSFALGSTGIPILPEIRFTSSDTNTVNDTTMTAWFVE